MDITNDSRAPFSHWSFQGQIWALLHFKQEGWRRLLEKILKSRILQENFTPVTVIVRNWAKFGHFCTLSKSGDGGSLRKSKKIGIKEEILPGQSYRYKKLGEIWAEGAAGQNYWQKVGKKLCGNEKRVKLLLRSWVIAHKCGPKVRICHFCRTWVWGSFG